MHIWYMKYRNIHIIVKKKETNYYYTYIDLKKYVKNYIIKWIISKLEQENMFWIYLKEWAESDYQIGRFH